MLTLRRITCENFRLLRSVSLDVKPGIFFIRGVNKAVPQASSNMSGKSTLLSAITWALYGVDSAGDTLADSVVSSGETSCRVHLEFEQQSGQRLSIVRDRCNVGGTRNLVYVGETSKWGETLFEPADLTRGRISALVGAQDVMLASSIFGYDECYVPFARSGDKAQKRLFDLLVSASDLDAAFERAHLLYEDAERERKTAQHTVAILEAKRSTLLELRNNDTGHEDVRKAKQLLSVCVSKLRNAAAAANVARHGRTEAHKLYVARLGGIDSNIADVRKKEQKLWAVKGSLNAQRKEITASHDALILSDSGSNRQCPVCDAPLSASKRTQLLTDRKCKLHDLDQQDNACHQTLSDMESSVAVLNRKREALCASEQKLCNEFLALESAVSLARTNAAAAKQSLLSVESAETARRTSMLTSLHDVEQALSARQQDVLEWERRRTILQFWREAFGPRGIRAYRLDKITPVLNALARSYSHRLFGDGMKLQYSTQTPLKRGGYKEAFDCCLVDKNGVAVRDGISAGQSMRRDITHAFAMCRLAQSLGARKLNLIAFDELFRTLDARGIERVMELLREEQQRYSGTIWVVEHNDDLASMFESTITVKRSGGASTVLTD